MRTTPATWSEVDSWLAVLQHHGHLLRATVEPDSTRSVQQGRCSRPRTLHHPVLAMDFVEHLVPEIRQRETEASR